MSATAIGVRRVRLGGAVMSHPRRRETAERLLARAGDWPLRLALDPQPDGPPTSLRTAVRAWSAVAAEHTHQLVLQDDAIPAPGFFERVQDVVEAVPDAAIALFTSWSSRNGAAVRLGALRDASFVRATDEYTPTVALVLPADIARGYAGYAAAYGEGWSDDVTMLRYLRSCGVPCYLSVPNLVEHDDVPSVASNDAHGLRRAACYTGAPVGSGWAAGDRLLEPTIVPFVKYGTALCAVRSGGSWMTHDAERYCRRLGFDTAGFRSGVRLDGDYGPVQSAELDALCLTAGLIGFLHGEPGGPHAEQAVSTLAAGALSARLDITALPQLHDRLDELVRDAIRQGAHLQSTGLPTGTRRRVAVIGERRDLTARLADDLAGQGHSVVTAAALHPGLRGSAAIVHVGPSGPGDAPVAARAGQLGVGQVVRIEFGADRRTERAGPGETVLRTGTPYGPGIGEPLLQDLVLRALTRRPIHVTTPLPAPAQLVHIDDLCRAVERALAVRRPGTYDICAGPPVGPAELAETVCTALRRVPVIVTAGAEAVVPPALDATTARTELGWCPATSLVHGLRTLAQWLAYETDHWQFAVPEEEIPHGQ
jgi:hypothetical protein